MFWLSGIASLELLLCCLISRVVALLSHLSSCCSAVSSLGFLLCYLPSSCFHLVLPFSPARTRSPPFLFSAMCVSACQRDMASLDMTWPLFGHGLSSCCPISAACGKRTAAARPVVRDMGSVHAYVPHVYRLLASLVYLRSFSFTRPSIRVPVDLACHGLGACV